MSKYENLERETLIRLLERRDRERQLGLVWEQDNLEPDEAINSDYIALDLNQHLSQGGAPWHNLIIEGDNYDALRALRMSHAGRIRCIYIDPPYNTGSKDFVYNDHFVDATHRYRHSLWLDFMYRRLMLARDLLADDGVIFVSIDDNELYRLGMLMDRVFGEANFVANVIWQKVYSPKNSAQHFSDDHEYIVVFARKKEGWRPNPLPRTASQDKAYKNPDKDPRGDWKPGDLSARNPYSEGTYPITCPGKRVIKGPPSGRYWVVSKEKLEALDADNRIWWGKSGNNVPAIKRFLSEVKQGVVPQTLWTYAEVGHTQDGKKQLLDILRFDSSADVFSTPKPVQLMKRILRIAAGKNDTVLDFFAGSGTIAQALIELNAEDGGNRNFILVSNTEATPKKPERNLCRDICAERVRRVMAGYENSKGEEVPGYGGGFAYLRTQRLAPHRMSQRLRDTEVWRAVQMIHGLPLRPLPARGFATATGEGLALAYLADFKATNTKKLSAWAAEQGELPLSVYSWAPARAESYAPKAKHLPIPDALQARFRQQGPEA